MCCKIAQYCRNDMAVAIRPGDVTQRQNANQMFVTIDYWQSANFQLAHVDCYIVNRLIVVTVLDGLGHDIPYFGLRPLAGCGTTDSDVTISDYTYDTIAFAD